jgi:hypothetical protein
MNSRSVLELKGQMAERSSRSIRTQDCARRLASAGVRRQEPAAYPRRQLQRNRTQMQQAGLVSL